MAFASPSLVTSGGGNIREGVLYYSDKQHGSLHEKPCTPLLRLTMPTFMTSWHVACDAPEPWKLGMQDPASPVAEGLADLHSVLAFYITVIGVGVTWVMLSQVIAFRDTREPISHRYYNHGTVVELIWTITPAAVLLAIAFPSFRLLYLMDDVISPALTVKCVGSQWFWTYEASDFLATDGEPLSFDSYIEPESDVADGRLRLLSVDNALVLPIDVHTRFIVTGADVIHDFAVPSLGLKIDCTPGRLNEVSAIVERPGVYFGQCSELCGTYHGFMPICIEAVELDAYLEWLDTMAG